MKFKINSLQSLLARAYGLCSNYANLHSEFDFIKSIFSINGFSHDLISKQISKFLTKKHGDQFTAAGSKQILYCCIPYLGHHSDKLVAEMSNLLYKYFKDITFKFILTNNFKISSLFSYKDKLPKGLHSSLVYKFSCVQCTSEYVGSTSRTLATRVAEHAGLSFRTNQPIATPSHSFIREHSYECNSSVTLDNFSILDFSQNKTELRILESLYIHKTRPTLNSAQTAYPLHIVNK